MLAPTEGPAVTDDRSPGIDPRFPEVYQRAGADAPVSAPARRAPARASDPRPVVDEGMAAPSAAPGPRGPVAPSIAARAEKPERSLELVVVGNPWLRALWIVGGATLLLGIGAILYAQNAFLDASTSGFDRAALVLPTIASELSGPLVTGGVLALVAATCLRIAAWRPKGYRTLEPDAQ